MSCLSLSELPLSEQVALELLWSDKLLAKARDVLDPLDSSAVSPIAPFDRRPSAAGESNLFTASPAGVNTSPCESPAGAGTPSPVEHTA